MSKQDENLDPTEEELTQSFNEIVNGVPPQSSQEEEQEDNQEEQDAPNGEEEEEQQEEQENDEKEEESEEEQDDDPGKSDDEVSNLKAKNKRLTDKKNKWKEKYNTVKGKYDKLVNGELDDEFESERDRDLAIVEAQNEMTYAKNRSEEMEEQAVDDFYLANPEAKDNKSDIEQIMTDYGMNVEDAYKFHLAKTAPEKLYDQQKINQKKGGNGMMGSGGSAGGNKPLSDKSADDLERELEDSFSRGEQVL